MSVLKRPAVALSAAALILAAASSTAFAQKKYDTGASDKEIKIGNIMPYSGPASAYGVGHVRQAGVNSGMANRRHRSGGLC